MLQLQPNLETCSVTCCLHSYYNNNNNKINTGFLLAFVFVGVWSYFRDQATIGELPLDSHLPLVGHLDCRKVLLEISDEHVSHL